MNITLNTISENTFFKISNILNNDSEVNKYVSFNSKNNSYGIFLNDILIGLFSLHPYIDDNIVIHIALIQEYRNKGIGKLILNCILEKYGELYKNSENFFIDINYSNKKAINAFKKTDWIYTNEYNDLILDEVGEISILYKKENPFYTKRKELSR